MGVSSSAGPVFVDSKDALLSAVANADSEIRIAGRITGLPSFSLAQGQTLIGENDHACLVFDHDGISLSAANRLSHLALVAPATHPIIQIGKFAGDRGSIVIDNVRCTGQVQLIFGDETTAADVEIDRTTVVAADVSADRLIACDAVSIRQGAVTIWNRSRSRSAISVSIDMHGIGTEDDPVSGSGLLIGGAGEVEGGVVRCARVRLGSVFARSGLSADTLDTLAGAVFILRDVHINELIVRGSLVTRDSNAMPFDNWGMVDRCIIEGNLSSSGQNAIGLVNFGTIGSCEISGVIETAGAGARGCATIGEIRRLAVKAIRTEGDAAVGLQIVGRIASLLVEEDITTSGEPGFGLVRGAMVATPAHAIHIAPRGALDEYRVGSLRASGSSAELIFNEGESASLRQPSPGTKSAQP